MLLDLTCPECEKDFQKQHAQCRGKAKPCCSVSCAQKYRSKGKKNGKVVKCEQCGKEKYKSKKDLEKYKNHYCSKSCSIEALRNRWKHDPESNAFEGENDRYRWRRPVRNRGYEISSKNGEFPGWKTVAEINDKRWRSGERELSPSGLLSRVRRAQNLFSPRANQANKSIIQSYPNGYGELSKLLNYPAPNHRPKPTFGYATT